jgi:hypothetical protein
VESIIDQIRNRLVQPQSSGMWMKCRDLLGHPLVILRCHLISEEADPMNPGKSRYVATIDYVDLSEGVNAQVYKRAKVDKPGVVNKLDPNSQDIVMGRMTQGEAKVGQNPPFILGDSTPEDQAFFVEQWLPAHEAEFSDSPAPQSAPVAPAPVAAPPAPAPAASPTLPGLGQVPGMTPEAQAALAGMIARGELPGLGGVPAGAPGVGEPPF